jgi:hypothetical protein
MTGLAPSPENLHRRCGSQGFAASLYWVCADWPEMAASPTCGAADTRLASGAAAAGGLPPIISVWME